MKAMILAAGLGKRMRPLTDTIPKPLIPVRGKPLIEWHLERLAQAGIKDVIINIAYLGHKIRQALGDGSRWGLSIIYSEEPEPLETGGAILHAAKSLGGEPFILVNADVFTEFDLAELIQQGLSADNLGRLVLVPNPEFKSRGDFDLADDMVVDLIRDSGGYTFAGISVLDPRLVLAYPERRTIFPLVEALRWAIAQRRLQGMCYCGLWSDVGTPERLARLNRGDCSG